MDIAKGTLSILNNIGMTQKELSKRSGISEKSLSLLLSGSTTPKQSTVEAIAQVFNIKPEFLYVLSISINDSIDKDLYNIVWPMIEHSLLHLILPKNKYKTL